MWVIGVFLALQHLEKVTSVYPFIVEVTLEICKVFVRLSGGKLPDSVSVG